MDRQLIYPDEIIYEDDTLSTNLDVYIALGLYMQTVTGSSTLLSGFSCTQDSPPDMGVTVEAGQIYSLEVIDENPYSTLPADTTHQIIKQGIALNSTALPLTAPVTPGDAVNYLIQIAFDEADVDPQNRPYYNSADPDNPIFNEEPNLRQDSALVQSKAGTPAPLGTQSTPTPDPGFIGAYVVTVEYGQTTITDSDISIYSGAPFITETLTQKISQATADTLYPRKAAVQAASLITGVDSGAANAYVLSLTPALTIYSNGMEVRMIVSNANTAASTLNVSGQGAVPILNQDGSPLAGGELPANSLAILYYLNGNFYISNPANASGGFGTGDGKMSLNPTVQAGWVPANDGTIGSATSGATTRANADTFPLYKMLWNYSTALFPSFTSAGLLTTRGASATADFAANVTIQLGYVAGRAMATSGLASYIKTFVADGTANTLTVDETFNLLTGTPVVPTTQGGTLPSGLTSGTTYYAIRISSTVIQLATSQANALAGTVLPLGTDGSGTNILTVSLSNHAACSYVGEEAHNQLDSEVGPHVHIIGQDVFNNIENDNLHGGGDDLLGSLYGGTFIIQPNVGGSPFNIMQPTFFWNVYIKL